MKAQSPGTLPAPSDIMQSILCITVLWYRVGAQVRIEGQPLTSVLSMKSRFMGNAHFWQYHEIGLVHCCASRAAISHVLGMRKRFMA